VQVKLPSHLRWSLCTDKADVLKTSMHAGGASLPFKIGCRTDAMVVASRSQMTEEASIMATVEMKKKVVMQSLRQTKVTFVCASLKSQLPVISCVTDMGASAVAYYTAGQRRGGDGAAICIEHFFNSATEMMKFLNKALGGRSVSADVMRLKDDKIVLPSELPHPKRVRLPVPSITHSQALELRNLFTDFLVDGNDIGCIGEIETMYEESVGLSYYS